MTLAFDAVIFDLDGVITQTAVVHRRAWKKTFDAFLRNRANETGEPFVEFADSDYFHFVDGKPRYEGVASFLRSRGIELPFGQASDGPDQLTVCGLGNRKNRDFLEAIESSGVDVYPSTIALINQLLENGVKVAVASSSKSCRRVLDRIGYLQLFQVCIDGETSEELGLKGKPNPDIFVAAMERIGASRERTVIVEDAVSGVQAGEAGRFGLVLGVARENNHGELRQEGADIVVSDLSDISIERINQWFICDAEVESWRLTYCDVNDSLEPIRETLLSIGNGFMGVRGAHEEVVANGISYPGTYVGGVYNSLESVIGGQTVTYNDFVNLPSWIPCRFRIDDGAWFEPRPENVLKCHRYLDLKRGVLVRQITVVDDKGRETELLSERFCSATDVHCGGQTYSITPKNYSGVICVEAGVDGAVINSGVSRYGQLSKRHLRPLQEKVVDGLAVVEVETTKSRVSVAVAARLQATVDGNSLKPLGVAESGRAFVSFVCSMQPGQTLVVEKVAAVVTTREGPLGDGGVTDKAIALVQSRSLAQLLERHTARWAERWERTDIVVRGDRFAQRVLRLHAYHILSTASRESAYLDRAIPPRGLNGESYRGKIFWDELYILPWLLCHYPEIAKQSIRYRYWRLDAARRAARAKGYRGAMFPWNSGETGAEETPTVHYNPKSGTWGPDHSSLQRHVSLAIAMYIWQYYTVTRDVNFLEECAAEVFVDIAEFFASAAKEEDGRWHITGMMGPDEFKEHSVKCPGGGLRDNAYINFLVSWLLEKGEEILSIISTLACNRIKQAVGLTDESLTRWRTVKDRLQLVVDDNGIVAQFDGYFDLKEFDFDFYAKKYGNFHRADRILKAENLSPDDYKVGKQADWLLVYYLFTPEEVEARCRKLGYALPADAFARNFDYYLARTSHGSTLSKIVHAGLAQLLGRHDLAASLYHDALISDIRDVQGGTTGEGIHAGVMAATVWVAQRFFGGIDINIDRIVVRPNLPRGWHSVAGRFAYQGQELRYEISHSEVALFHLSGKSTVPVCISDKFFELVPGGSIRLALG